MKEFRIWKTGYFIYFIIGYIIETEEILDYSLWLIVLNEINMTKIIESTF